MHSKKSFSVKTFDRSRNGCQVIRLGRETVSGGLPGRRSLSRGVSPSRAPVFSCPPTSKRLLRRPNFELEPSILNRDLPQVFWHNLTKYLLIFS